MPATAGALGRHHGLGVSPRGTTAPTFPAPKRDVSVQDAERLVLATVDYASVNRDLYVLLVADAGVVTRSLPAWMTTTQSGAVLGL